MYSDNNFAKIITSSVYIAYTWCTLMSLLHTLGVLLCLYCIHIVYSYVFIAYTWCIVMSLLHTLVYCYVFIAYTWCIVMSLLHTLGVFFVNNSWHYWKSDGFYSDSTLVQMRGVADAKHIYLFTPQTISLVVLRARRYRPPYIEFMIYLF